MITIVLCGHCVVSFLNGLCSHQVILFHILSESPIAAGNDENAKLCVSPSLVLELALPRCSTLSLSGSGPLVDCHVVHNALDERNFDSVVYLMKPCAVVTQKDAVVEGHVDFSELFLELAAIVKPGSVLSRQIRHEIGDHLPPAVSAILVL